MVAEWGVCVLTKRIPLMQNLAIIRLYVHSTQNSQFGCPSRHSVDRAAFLQLTMYTTMRRRRLEMTRTEISVGWQAAAADATETPDERKEDKKRGGGGIGEVTRRDT